MTATGLAYQAEPIVWARTGAEANRNWCRIKNVATVNRASLPENTDPELLLKYVDIGNVDSDGHLGLPEELIFDNAPSRARRRVLVGDSIVSTVRTYLRAIAYIDVGAEDLIISTGFATVTPEGVDDRFLYWWLRSTPFIEEIVARSVGVSYPAINATDVEDVGIGLPSVDEQRTIAEFLDDVTAHVDALIAEEKALRELVVDRREAEVDRVIEHGGLSDGLVPIDSLWVDAIPAGWRLMPLKWCVDKVTVGIVVNPSHYYEESGVPVLRGLNIRRGRVINEEDLVYMSDASNAFHAKSRLEQGDVVVVRTGATGAAAVVPDWAVGGNIVDLLLVRPGARMRPKFLELMLNSRFVQRQITYGSVGALQAHFNTTSLSNVLILVPTLEEQDRVVAYLSEHLERYDQLIAEADHAVELLRERREALITTAVRSGLSCLSLRSA